MRATTEQQPQQAEPVRHFIAPNCRVTIIRKGASRNEFIVRGMPSNDKWVTAGKAADDHYCNVSLCGGCFGGIHISPGHVDPGAYVCGFGGEVWPGAWPELFTSPPRGNYACGPNGLTALGLSLFRRAAGMME